MKRIGKTIFAVLMAVVVLAGCTMKLIIDDSVKKMLKEIKL